MATRNIEQKCGYKGQAFKLNLGENIFVILNAGENTKTTKC